MITLTAEIKIQSKNGNPFVLGESVLGDHLFGESVEEVKEINQRSILSLTGNLFDRGNEGMPDFGVISSGGSVSFNDKNLVFYNYAVAGILKSGYEVRIFCNNTLSKASEQLGVFYADEWEYDNNSKRVSVSLKDGIEEWQEINYGGINYDPRNSTSKNFEWLYKELSNFTKEKSKIWVVDFKDLDEKTKKLLSELYIEYPVIFSGNIWSVWQKFGEATQTHIFKNKNGLATCKYNGGN